MNITSFNTRLKSARKLKHFTQLDLANRLDVSKGTVSAATRTGLSPTIMRHLPKICNILDTSADYLLGISDDLTFKMGKTNDEQTESILQFISLIEKQINTSSKNTSTK